MIDIQIRKESSAYDLSKVKTSARRATLQTSSAYANSAYLKSIEEKILTLESNSELPEKWEVHIR